MIAERVGDLLEQDDVTHLGHQANLFHTFGAGLAAQIKKFYPHGLAADKRTPHGDVKKLGTYSVGQENQAFAPWVVNIYSQDPEGGTNYVALRKALTALEAELRDHLDLGNEVLLGLPYKLGCGIAGGDWKTVRGIIQDVFGPSMVKVVIVTRPEDRN